MTPEQVGRSQAAIRELAQATAHQLIREAFSGFKSSRGSGVSLTFKPGPPHRPRPLPTYVERETVRTFHLSGRWSSRRDLRPAGRLSVLRA